MTAETTKVTPLVKRPSIWARAGQWLLGEKRSAVQTVTSSDQFSNWKQLLFSLSGDTILLDENTAQSIPAFNRAIEIIASQIASLPFSVYETDDSGRRVEAKGHTLYPLLKYRPHPLYNSYDFRAAVIRLLMLRGNCFVHMKSDGAGGIRQLEIIDKSTADIIKVDDRYFYKFAGLEKPIDSEDVLHFKLNSKDGISGQSTLEMFRDSLERAQAEIKLGKVYYTKGGQVGGVLAPDQPMSPKQYESARAAWAKHNVGIDKIGQVGMLPVGMKYVKLGDSLNENQLNQSRGRTTEDISNMTGVHPILLGSMASASFGNVEELNRVFVQFTLRSFIKVIEDTFNTKAISSADRETVKVRFNTTGLLRGDTKARSEYYLKMRMVDAISPNEIRALENMNARDGGDAFGLPLASNVKPEPTGQNKTSDGQS